MAKTNELKEVAIDVYATISNFSNKSVLKGYYSAVITKDLFKSEEEYLDFYEMLYEYVTVEKKTSIQKAEREVADAFLKLHEKYPSQTDVLILECAYDLKQPSFLKSTIRYLSSKDIISTRMTPIPMESTGKYYRTIGILTSKTISQYMPEIKYSKLETQFSQDFLTSDLSKKAFENLNPEDLVYCAKDSRFSSSLYFSFLNILTDEAIPEEERYKCFTSYVNGEIKNIDLDKLKLIMLYRYFETLKSQENIDIDTLKEFENTKKEFEKITGTTSILVKPSEIKVPALDANDFEYVSVLTGLPYVEKQNTQSVLSTDNMFDMKNNMTMDSSITLATKNLTGGGNIPEQDFPIFSVTDDSSYVMRTVVLDETLEISKKELSEQINAFLKKHKMRLFVEASINDRKIDSYLQSISINPEIIESLESIISENLDKESKDYDELLKNAKLSVLTNLINTKLFRINEAMTFDTNLLCEGIVSGKINIDKIMFEKIKQNIDRTSLIEVAIQNQQLLKKLVQTRNISKEDLFKMHLSSYKELVEYFFNNGMLNTEDIIELSKQGKISPKDIENISFNDLTISNNLISSIYLKIQEKKNEYEESVKKKYEDALAKGIDEENVSETEDEKRLQSELQELINLKNIYLALFRSQSTSKIEIIHRAQDIYIGFLDLINEDNFEHDLIEITKQYYSDEMISMNSIQELDDSLVIEILKSGLAKKADIESFKEGLVSSDEIELIRKELEGKYSGKELEEKIKQSTDNIKYQKLEKLMINMIDDPQNSKEEKLNILYSLFSGSSKVEREYREFFESIILVKVYEKIKRKSVIINGPDEEEIDDEEMDGQTGYDYRKFVYSTDIIWSFMRVLDSDLQSQVLADGYVLFKSEKLNKVFIENLWQPNKQGDFVRRGYGAATIVIDYDTFKAHETDIIKLRRNGYKVDVYEAKANLPKISTPKGEKTKGIIIHEKDLKNVGKKIWFELILEHLGIDTAKLEDRDSIYTKEEIEEIKKFVEESRYRYEEIDSK